MVKSTFAYFIFALLLSCQDSPVESLTYTKILVDNNVLVDKFDLSEFIQDVRIIPLSEEQGNFMVGVFKLIPFKGNYIAYDRRGSKLLLFDSAGKFQRVVMKNGDGPNDALNIHDCWVNGDGNLQVYDYAQFKIYTFDSSLAHFSVTKGSEFYHFSSIRDIPGTKSYAGYADFNQFNAPYKGKLFHIGILNEQLDLTGVDNTFERIFEGVPWLTFSNHYFPYNDTLRFFESYNNSVYDISTQGATVRYKVAYERDNLPEDVLPIVREHLEKYKDPHTTPNEKAAFLKKYARLNGRWIENEKYIYFVSRDSKGEFGDTFFTLYNKQQGKVVANTKTFTVSTKFGLTLPTLEAYDKVTDEYIGVVNGIDLKDMVSRSNTLSGYLNQDLDVNYLVKVKFK
ncbi:6-bladed beta-propeller [Flavihumibacter petaseus]|uniref:6-bladed beta-propeller n=1 Tax=Flavihumibacter petaseus NBRC 106054 TaxID=1220578 RepID=A0A0E9MWK0_9BACT|nr:6-bladed beta-propeller [Flavihumibacter petaseus]GAO41954.1 hypothetical protein FPE01S_01_09670 [Flavihumibacter petaseus NBRC 106054]